MKKHRVLIIEDDKEINGLLCDVLLQSNFHVKSCYSGLEGFNMLKNNLYDMVILDLMLPFKSGDIIIKELRTFSQVPVIIISAKDTTQSKIDLLRLGADDYITKPFDIDELLARIETNLRRCYVQSNIVKTNLLKYKDIVLNSEKKQVFVNNKEVILTSKEYKIIELLLQNPQKVFSKNNIFESVWGIEYISDDNTLNVHISNLRNKLKFENQTEQYIETVWGMGYRLFKI